MKKIMEKVKNEVMAVVPPTIFFVFAIGLLILTKRLMLTQYGIQFSDVGAAIVGGLIIGKVILIVDHLPFVDRFPNKPLIYNVAWKSVLYGLAAFLVRLAEHLIPLVIKHGSLWEAVAHIIDEVVWPRFWVIYLWLFVLLFVYCSASELIRAVGRDQVLKLFFGISPRRPE